MPPEYLHYANIAAAFVAIILGFNMSHYSLGMLLASISPKHRKAFGPATLFLSFSLMVSTFAYQWFLSAMGR